MISRPTATLNPLFFNVPPHVPISQRTAPRIVQNLLTKNLQTYTKAAGWSQNAADEKYTWGGDVDGGQWVEFSAGAGEQVFVTLTLSLKVGQRYILSLIVDSKTGTLDARNFQITTSGHSGTWHLTNPDVGRHALVFTATSSGTTNLRIGIGTNVANTGAATLRISNVQAEISTSSARDYPYEYVQPSTTRAYNYTNVTPMTGTLCGTPTLGEAYEIPRTSSVLVVGDSFSDSNPNLDFGGTEFGDYPFHMQRMLPVGRFSVNTRAISGQTIAQITTQIENALTESVGSVGAAPYGVIIAQGGVNDMILSGRTLAQMQADKLAQIAVIEAAGAVPVLVGIAAWDGYVSWTSDRQAQTIAYNAWLSTLGYPLYDIYTDSDDGTGTMKTSWGSSDGLHPGTGYAQGQFIIGRRLSALIQLIGD